MLKQAYKRQKEVALRVYIGIVILTVAIIIIVISLNLLHLRLNKEFVAKAGEPVQTTYDLQYQTITHAGITQTGNSITLSPTESVIKQMGSLDKDFGDVYTSLDDNLQVEGYPAGTTRNWQENGSKATLSIPEGSEILHAQLVWSANYKHLNKPENDVTNQIDLPIKLSKDDAQERITPDPDYTYRFIQEIPSINKIRYEYVNTANVTDFIKQNGAGEYAVSEVPGVLSREMERYSGGIDNPDNWAGWTLIVAFKNYNLPIRNVSIFTGLQKAVAEFQENLPAKIDGFGTPTSGKMNARLFISAAEGDGILTGDQLKIGDSEGKMFPISGDNNPETNFFNSLILDEKNQIDTTGSFGNYNQSINQNLHVKRQGWDITTIDVSNFIQPGQTQALILGTSKGDGYNINALAMEIDVYAPRFELKLDHLQPITNLGETIDYTFTITNTGLNEARLVTIPITVPLGTELIPNSLESPDYALSPDNDGSKNEEIESFKSNQQITLKYKVKVNQIPNSTQITNQIPVTYKYQMTKNSSLITETSKSNQVLTEFRSQQETTQTPESNPNPNQTPITNENSENNEQNSDLIIDSDSTYQIETQNSNPPQDQTTNDEQTQTPENQNNSNDENSPVSEYFESPSSNQPLLTPNSQRVLARPDFASISLNETIKIPIIKNDLYNVEESVNISLDNLPVNGNAYVESNEIVYTSNNDFIGAIKFDYNLCQYEDICSKSTVTVNVSKSELVNLDQRQSVIPLRIDNVKLPRTGADYLFWGILFGVVSLTAGFAMTTISFYDPKNESKNDL